MRIKGLVKKLRASQPFNQYATTVLKSFFAATGLQSEFVINHLPRTGMVAVALPDGQQLKLNAGDEAWIPTQLFWRGWQGYEAEMTPLFYQLAQRAGTTLDVGAHLGFFSLLAGLANPAAQVFAFEPLAPVYELLERNVALNQLTNVHCLHVALGAVEGQQEFYFPDGYAPVASSLRSDKLLESLPSATIHHLPVSVRTIDEIVKQHRIARVGLIKLDTERTEHDVLAGGAATLARDRPDIICEVWPDAGNGPQLEDLLRPHGYRFYQLFPDGIVAKDAINGDPRGLNYLFTVGLDEAVATAAHVPQ